MKNTTKILSLLVLLLLIAAVSVVAQRGGGHTAPPQHGAPPRANGGHLPPPPVRRPDGHTERDGERLPNGHVDESQHVRNDQWYGHDRPDDTRFHLDRPFEHGRFTHVGAGYRYPILRIDAHLHRFWFPGGFFFDVAAWDWFECEDWCWTCGDDFVIYEDPDHIGWYLVYNIHTGVYVHVMYMGM